jgi:hypothetical protein
VQKGNRLSLFVFGGLRYGDILVPSVGLHDQHALQRGFAVGLRKTTECLGGAGRSQDLPDAGCLLACSHEP